MAFWQSLRKNEVGAAALEYALLSPIVITIGLSGIELAYHAMARSVLESAVRDASRFGITGNSATITDPVTHLPTPVSRDQYIRIIIQNAMAKFPAPSGVSDPLTITPRIWGSYNTSSGAEQLATDANGNGICDAGDTYYDVNGNGVRDTNLSASGFGGTGDIVIYTVDYKTPVIFDFLWTILDHASADPANKIADFKSVIAVRNEGTSTAVVRSC